MKIIISHIPKTAGTSLVSLVNLNYPVTRRYCCYPFPTESDFALVKQSKSIQIVISHIEFGLHSKFDFPANYISFMREPVSQVLSNYGHLKTKGFDNQLSRDIELEQFLQSEDGCNLQTQYFSGVLFDEEQFQEDPESVFELAKHNMDRYYLLVGLQERYTESIYLIRKILGWKYSEYKRLNENKEYIKEIDNEVRDIIIERNNLDIRLYAYATKRFQDDFEEYKQGFNAEVRMHHLRSSNESYRKFKYLLLSRIDAFRNRISRYDNEC